MLAGEKAWADTCHWQHSCEGLVLTGKLQIAHKVQADSTCLEEQSIGDVRHGTVVYEAD